MIGSRFYLRLVLAWLAVLVAAVAYCTLHGLVKGEFDPEFGVTARWALVHWGAWPLLLPICFWLIRVLEARASFVVGLAVAFVAAIVGSGVFALAVDAALGGEWALLEAIYHMAPYAAGTFLLFVAVCFWLIYPALLSVRTNEAVVVEDGPTSLPVWKGQLKTTIDVDRIEWARAARNYVEFFADGHSYIVRDSMSRVEQLLSGSRFLRTHRSYLVNTDRIAGLHGGRSRPAIVVRSGSRIPVGKTYRDAVFDAVGAPSAAHHA